nr:MAG TPA: core protein [Caudoviricetes sp.]
MYLSGTPPLVKIRQHLPLLLAHAGGFVPALLPLVNTL